MRGATGARPGVDWGISIPLDDLRTTGVLDSALITSAFRRSRFLGIRRTRIDFEGEWVFWGNSAGRYWSDPDAVYNACVQFGLRPLFIMKSIPAWAQPAGGSAFSYPDASQVSAFGLCMEEAAARYPNADWELWNEHNLAIFSHLVGTGASTATCAAAYMTAAASIATSIRTANPSARIISHGLSPVPTTLLGSYLSAVDYLTAMYANGAGSVFDAIGFHPYTWPEPWRVPTASYNGWNIMKACRAIQVANGGAGKKIWITEAGAPTGGTSSTPMSLSGQARQVRDIAAEVPQRSWIGPVYWYTLKNRPAEGTDTENHFGLWTHGGVMKPAGLEILNGSQLRRH